MATNVKSYKINQNLIDDLERVINIQENWFDKSVIISHFLRSIEVSFIAIFKTIILFFMLN